MSFTSYVFFAFLCGTILGSVISWLVYGLYFQNERSELMSSSIRYKESSRILQEEYDRYRNELPKQLQEWFELYINKELNKQKNQLSQTSKENIDNTLKPFRENLANFHRMLINDRTTIINSLQEFSSFSEAMRKDYHSLVSVLRGNIKFQGHWGEISLRRIFENAGLVENQDYTLQGKNVEMYNDANNRQKPDAVVYLPSEKHLIIDAKSPLKYYEECVNNQTKPEIFDTSLQKFCQALKIHITDLSQRFYQSHTRGLSSPDFVLLFLPIDGILNLLVRHKSELLDYAASKKVSLTTPSTLLLSMKTIASLWLLERQNRNTSKIIDLSSRMCDKLVSFVETLQSVGDGLHRAQVGYDVAMRRLSIGHDSLISRAKKLQTLGISTKKPDGVLNDVQIQYGQTNDRFGQTNDRFGQTNDRFGQANDRFGQANDIVSDAKQDDDLSSKLDNTESSGKKDITTMEK